MSRRDRGRAGGHGRTERVRALLEAGDHAAARAEASALLADATASDGERAAARAALDGLRPDRGALVAGLLGVATAIGVGLWTVLRG